MIIQKIVGKNWKHETDKEKSAFSDEHRVLIEFERIIANAKFKYIIVSYSDKGLMKKKLY